jgi:two-component system, chemotaxis family, sensor kinase Cph1
MEAQVRLAATIEFASRAGHDMLGPLNQAGSVLTLFVKRYRNQLDGEAELLLDFIMGAVSRIESVHTGMQDYLKLAGMATLLEPVDLNEALCQALASLQPEILRSGAVIAPDRLPDRITADLSQMTMMFRILVQNAIRFRSPSEPPHVRITAQRAEGSWAITVEDNGIGVDSEYRESILLPFRRLNGKEYPGAGLGLAMANLVARLHGGSIRIASASAFERGTSVEFTVPDKA